MCKHLNTVSAILKKILEDTGNQWRLCRCSVIWQNLGSSVKTLLAAFCTRWSRDYFHLLCQSTESYNSLNGQFKGMNNSECDFNNMSFTRAPHASTAARLFIIISILIALVECPTSLRSIIYHYKCIKHNYNITLT